MWIRSQCGNILMDCDFFAVEEHGAKYEVITLSGKRGISIGLGTYSTKEKAINVLYEIQEKINYEHSYTIDLMDEKVYLLNEDVNIYQMPQDEDVEE